MVRIGIIKEGKNPPDTRVPFAPDDVAEIISEIENISIEVQSSPDRCFTDEEYEYKGIKCVEKVDHADIFFGVKEVPIENLIPGKTFFFFSHTKKKQPYNQKLMHALIEKKIRMIDYESLVDENGDRIIGFGFYAGIVGAHNGLLTYGRKHNLYNLTEAYKAKDYDNMIAQYKDIKWPKIKIAVTGSGRVAKGIWNIMNAAGIKEVCEEEYLNKNFDDAVWVKLEPKDLYQHKENGNYNRDDFHKNASQYICTFQNFVAETDLLLNGIYWNDDIPRLFEKHYVSKESFRISVISDITCDVNGSVPINVGASTIADPVYGINRNNLEKVKPFQNNNEVIDVMAVDNLPNELARDASTHFGDRLKELIIPEILKENSELLDRATICKDGKLTKHFLYLEDYAYKND